MSRSDYAHWNEEQDIVWWQEEGKHHGLNEPEDQSWRDEPEGDDESTDDGYIREERG